MTTNIEKKLFEIGFLADFKAQQQNFFIEKELNELEKERKQLNQRG